MGRSGSEREMRMAFLGESIRSLERVAMDLRSNRELAAAMQAEDIARQYQAEIDALTALPPDKPEE